MMSSLLLLNLSALLSLVHCFGMFWGFPCVSAQGVCKALFCLRQCMKVSDPAHLSAKLLLCLQAPPLLSVPQV